MKIDQNKVREVVGIACQKLGILPAAETKGIGYEFSKHGRVIMIDGSKAKDRLKQEQLATKLLARELELMGVFCELHKEAEWVELLDHRVTAKNKKHRMLAMACRACGVAMDDYGFGDDANTVYLNADGQLRQQHAVAVFNWLRGAGVVCEVLTSRDVPKVVIVMLPRYTINAQDMLHEVEQALVNKLAADRELRDLMAQVQTPQGLDEQKVRAHMVQINVLIGKYMALASLCGKWFAGNIWVMQQLEAIDKHWHNFRR